MAGSKRWSADGIPDLSGKVAIVTGGNAGIGLATCHELARKGATVYMLTRTQSKAQAAIDEIKKQNPKAIVQFIPFDLTSIASCKKAAAEFLSKEERLDILINNAGAMFLPTEVSEDGVDLVACNATGHYALTIPLIPILKSTAALPDAHVRVVNVTSAAHELASSKTIDFGTLDGFNAKGKKLGAMARYGNSKLGNVFLTDKLQEVLEGTGIRCLSVHPGPVSSEMPSKLIQWYWPLSILLVPVFGLFQIFAYTPAQGALGPLYAATSPQVDELDLKAAYLVPIAKVGKKVGMANDEKSREGFWKLCEQLTAENS